MSNVLARCLFVYRLHSLFIGHYHPACIESTVLVDTCQWYWVLLSRQMIWFDLEAGFETSFSRVSIHYIRGWIKLWKISEFALLILKAHSPFTYPGTACLITVPQFLLAMLSYHSTIQLHFFLLSLCCVLSLNAPSEEAFCHILTKNLDTTWFPFPSLCMNSGKSTTPKLYRQPRCGPQP